jgi:hypothetical protein
VWAGSYDVTTCADDRLTLYYAKLDARTYYLPAAPPIVAGDGYIMNVRADTYGSHAPSNDECAGAIPLNVGTVCNPVNYLPECATQSLPAIDCGVPDANANDDVWYSFTAPDNLVTLAVFAQSFGYSPVIDVYSGTCGALTSFDCVDVAAQDISAQLTLFGLNAGATYYFRMYNGYGTTPLDNASYDLCAVEGDEVVIGVAGDVKLPGRGVFPNPGNGDFTVRTDAPNNAHVTLIDAVGRNVRVDALRGIGQITVHGAGLLQPGSYVLSINDGRTVELHRLVVQ